MAKASAQLLGRAALKSTRAAAAMVLAAPTSAAAALGPYWVARLATTWPKPAATYKARQTASSSAEPVRQSGSSTAGSMPQLPAVVQSYDALHAGVALGGFECLAMTWTQSSCWHSVPRAAACSTLAASPPTNRSSNDQHRSSRRWCAHDRPEGCISTSLSGGSGRFRPGRFPKITSYRGCRDSWQACSISRMEENDIQMPPLQILKMVTLTMPGWLRSSLAISSRIGSSHSSTMTACSRPLRNGRAAW